MAIFDIFKRFQIIEKTKVSDFQKSVNDLKVIRNYLRPEDESAFNINRAMSWSSFDSRVSPVELYQLSEYSDILINIFNTLKNEVFRSGFDYTNISTYENDLQLKKIEQVIKKANMNNQTLIEVLKEIENDLNVQDDAYLFARKNFFVNSNNEIIGGEVIEFLRIHPLSVEIIFDDTSRLAHNKEGKPVYFDVENRGEITEKEYNKNGIKNMRACYKVKAIKGTGGNSQGYQYFDTSEILHVSKYRPSKTYGFSPLYSLYNKIITLINMDYYIKQYYSGNKVPKGLLTVNTSNSASFMARWDAFIEQIKKNPHSINPLIHQSGDGKKPIEWIDFMRNLQEMQYTEVRNEIRTQIGAVYNVSPMFMNDVSTGGGLNNEGLQITVTDRGVEMGQQVYNDKVLVWISDQLGVTDYKWILLPSKEQDKVYESDLRLKEIAIARATAELGISVSMNETGDFSYSAGKVEIKDPTSALSSFYDVGKSIEKAREVSGFESPEPGNIPEHEKEILAATYASCRKDGGDKEKCAKIAWGAVQDSKKNLMLKLSEPTQLLPKEEKAFENALLTELEKLLRKLDLKTRPSKAELDKKVAEIVKEFDSTIKTKSSRKLKAIYQKAMAELGKEIGREFSLIEVDKNVIEGLKREPVYQKAFAVMGEDLSSKLKEAIVGAYDKPEGFSINSLVEDMRESADDVEFRLRRIARTETSKIAVAARKVQYDKTGVDYNYFHIGPDDNRTTDASKEIKRLTKNGVGWGDYVNTIIKVAKKYNPKWVVNKEFPISHPNTRHIFIARRA